MDGIEIGKNLLTLQSQCGESLRQEGFEAWLK